MRDIDQNQFQPNNTNNKHTAHQGNNVAKKEDIPNGEAQTKHPLSRYKRRWLMTPPDEEQSIGTGIMLRLKRRWDKQYPQKNHISKQNLRDNAARFKKELEMNVGSEEAQIEIEQAITLNNIDKWSTKQKVNLSKIEERERNQEFMERIKSMSMIYSKIQQ